jgi:N-acetyl-1-D-myo-inositol-2-amino-2-deoxy-alpha-D-glucopyranoside deacetylase
MSDRDDFSGKRLLALFAHPDDEAFSAAGSFAYLVDHGATVTLVDATRGEAGEISDPKLATPENLGAVREQELRTSMAQVGVSDVRFLGYRDSGMEGTEENKDPRAFMNASPIEVAAQLRAIIDEVKPDAVLTFGPDGGYGHPDHKMISRTGTAAVLTADWETPALYYTAMPRELFEELVKRAIGPFADMPPETVAKMGTPSVEIDVWVNVRPELERKWAALMAHRTQMSPDGPMAGAPQEDVTASMAVETFRRIPLPWKTPERGLLDLLPEGPRTRLPQRGEAAG